MSVSAFIAKTLNDALRRAPASPDAPFRLVTVDGTGPAPGIDLDRPRALEDDEETAIFTPAKRGA